MWHSNCSYKCNFAVTLLNLFVFSTLQIRFAWILKMDSFDEIAGSIKPDPTNAMILLAERSSQTNRSKALSILHQIEVEPISYEILRSEYPAIILIYLPVDDLPEAVLKLTGNGFTKMKAIHPMLQGKFGKTGGF